MKTIDFVYDKNKYCVVNFLDDSGLLSRKVWFDDREECPHDRKDLSIVSVVDNMATCAYTELDRNIGEFVELTVEVPVENLHLCGSEAVEVEYERILSTIDEEAAAIIRGLVWEKERDAAVAGYNGCI